VVEKREQITVLSQFVTKRQGKDVASYLGLLDAAHRDGLTSMRTTLLQFPNDTNGNVAITHATVVTSKGTFDGIGDASVLSVGRMVALHFIRMSETRALARALRNALNAGMICDDELEEDTEDAGQNSQTPRQPAPQRPTTQPTPIRPVATKDGMATQQQIERITSMSAKLGNQPPNTDGMTSIQAAEAIAGLVTQLNNRQKVAK